ncbi:Ig-like domain-containing protein [Rufibacter latericius]|nr:Ig-like domain-containing protein [Rufibacter latericius]
MYKSRIGIRVVSGGSNYTPLDVAAIETKIGKKVLSVAEGGAYYSMYYEGPSYHSLALAADGTVYAWGDNAHGQLGTGTHEPSAVPIQVPGLTGVKAIAAGYYHSLAIGADDMVYGWGSDGYGQLSSDGQIEILKPVPVPGLGKVKAIDCGSFFSLALDMGGVVFTWGDGAQPELGSFQDSDASLRPLFSGAKAISATAWGGTAIGLDDKVYGWGYFSLAGTDLPPWWSGKNPQYRFAYPVEVQGIIGAKAINGIIALGKDDKVYNCNCALEFNQELACPAEEIPGPFPATCVNPVVSFTATPAVLNSVTSFTDHSTNVVPDAVYSWDFNGDGISDSNTRGNTTYTYKSVGTHTAKLTVSNGICEQSHTIKMQVQSSLMVALTSPSAGGTFSGPATIAISAAATDADGTIAKVEFFQGTTKLGEDLTTPYYYDWDGVAPGSYILSAKATDNSGNTVTSVPVPVSVKPTSLAGTQWNYAFGGSGSDNHSVTLRTSDGGYILGGTSSSPISGDMTESGRGGRDFWVVKVSSAGVKLWDRRFGGSADEELNSLIETSDGGYLLGGYSSSGISGDKTEVGRGGRDFWVVKIGNTGSKQWDRRFGGSADDELRALTKTTDGGYLLAGTSFSGAGGDKMEVSRGGADYWAVKINSTGTKLWNKRFGGSANDVLSSVVEALDGTFLLAGTSASGITGDRKQASQGGTDYWVVKMNGSGTKQWDRRFGGSVDDELYSLAITPEGGYLLGGRSFSGISGDKSQASQGGSDFWLLKMGSGGDKLWDKGYGGTANDELRSVALSSDGGYLLAGTSASGVGGGKSEESRGGSDYWAVKVTGVGSKQWDRRFGGAADDELRTVLQTSDEGYVLTGLSGSGIGGDRTQSSQGMADFWAVKITSTGINQPPVVSLTLSLNGTTFTAPATIPLNATASDVDGTITKVEFYQGTTKIGEDLMAPYSYGWDGVAPGSYSLTAKATDNLGAQITSSPITVTVNLPDYCASNLYTDGCSSNDYINNFSFNTLVNNGSGCSNGSAGYIEYAPTGTLTTTVNRGQSYSVSMQAGAEYAQYFAVWIDYNNDRDFDDAGEYVYESPTSSISVFSGTFTIPSTAALGQVRMRVRCRYDNPLYDVAACDEFAYGEAEDYTITVATALPSVVLSSPSNQSFFTAPATINLAATAADPDGSITKVEFFNDSTKLGEDLSTPYTFQWSGVPEGSYWFTAKATDNLGASSVSESVQVKVYAPIVSGTQWNYRFGGSADDNLTAMVKTSDGGYLLGGTSASPISGDKSEAGRGGTDFWVVKVSSVGIKLWERRYGGTADEQLHAILATSDGGFLLGGRSASGISGDKTEASRGLTDFWVVKIGGTGVKQWDRRFGGSADDELRTLTPTSDGGFLLGGNSLSGSGSDKTEVSRGGIDYWIIKINSTGTKLWNKRFGGSANDELRSVSLTADGGFLLGGLSASGITGDRKQASQGLTDYWIVKVTDAGTKLWDRRFGGSAADELHSMALTTDGGFLLGGLSHSSVSGDKTLASRGGSDFWAVRINAAGDKLWDKGFGGVADDELRSLTGTTDGGFLLAGSSSSLISGEKTEASRGLTDYWVVKMGGTGLKQWDHRYGGTAADELRAVLQTSDGGFLLGGLSSSGASGDRTQPSQGLADFWIVKVGSTGTNQTISASTSINRLAEPPENGENSLSANPNPFTDKVTLQFELTKRDHASLKVFNEQGLEVATLFDGEKEAGRYIHEWHAAEQKSGVYILRLATSGGASVHRKVVLIR